MTAQANAVNVTGAGAVYAGPCTFRGCTIRDTSGATNTVEIFDNPSAAAGTVLFSVQLAANASSPPLAVADGIRASAGLFLQSTGAIKGSVWMG
jgi:hypothetical protein